MISVYLVDTESYQFNKDGPVWNNVTWIRPTYKRPKRQVQKKKRKMFYFQESLFPCCFFFFFYLAPKAILESLIRCPEAIRTKTYAVNIDGTSPFLP